MTKIGDRVISTPDEKMSNRPQILGEILSEERVYKWLDLPIRKGKKNHTLSNWISQGLRCIRMEGDRRFFLEQDIIEFFRERYNI